MVTESRRRDCEAKDEEEVFERVRVYDDLHHPDHGRYTDEGASDRQSDHPAAQTTGGHHRQHHESPAQVPRSENRAEDGQNEQCEPEPSQ
jgi:hypothetical protein